MEQGMVMDGQAQTDRKSGLSALIEIVIIALPLIVLGVVGTRLGSGTMLGGAIITLAYVISVGLAWLLLKRRDSSWKALGLARPESWRRTLLLAIGTCIAALVIIIIVQIVFLNLPGAQVEPIDQSRFVGVEGNVWVFVLMLAASWTTVAFGEEMIYRAFLMDRLSVVFQPTRTGIALAIAVSGIIFGLIHFVEGPLGIVSNGAFGMLFAWIYVRFGRNLWITIIAHALLNTLRFILIFGTM